jgi:hypothetical protein
MSFPVTTTTGLRATGLNGGSGYSASTLFGTNGLFIGIWIKGASDYYRGIQLYSDADVVAPYVAVGAYPATRSPWCSIRSGTQSDAIHTASDYADGSGSGNNLGWVLLWGKWDASTGDVTSGFGNMSGTTVSGDTDWDSWGSNLIKKIGVGVWRNMSDADEFSASTSYKLAMPFIVKRSNVTSGGGSELADLVAGVHPVDVFGSDLWDYWSKNSKTSVLNSIVLSDVGGTVTVDSSDNPPVSDPTGGGGGGGGCIVINYDF